MFTGNLNVGSNSSCEAKIRSTYSQYLAVDLILSRLLMQLRNIHLIKGFSPILSWKLMSLQIELPYLEHHYYKSLHNTACFTFQSFGKQTNKLV